MDLEPFTSGAPAGLELIELSAAEIELHAFRDRRGKRGPQLAPFVESDELCFTTPSGDLKPFKSEYEGYQGNYGNTLERWYHRAAVVCWPRARTFALRARAAPGWAVDQLAKLPEHQTEGRVSVHVISGHVQVRALGRTFNLRTGDLLALDPAIRHDVTAVDESAVLLTIAWPRRG